MRHAHLRVDTQHLLDELVLAEVDVHIGDGWQNRLEDGPRAGVVAGEERLRRPPEMLRHIVRVRLADASRRLGERLRVRDDAWGWTCGLPAGRASGRLREEPVDQRGSDVLVDIVEYAAHDRAELRRTEGIERLLDLDAFCRGRPSHASGSFTHVTSVSVRREPADAAGQR